MVSQLFSSQIPFGTPSSASGMQQAVKGGSCPNCPGGASDCPTCNAGSISTAQSAGDILTNSPFLSLGAASAPPIGMMPFAGQAFPQGNMGFGGFPSNFALPFAGFPNEVLPVNNFPVPFVGPAGGALPGGTVFPQNFTGSPLPMNMPVMNPGFANPGFQAPSQQMPAFTDPNRQVLFQSLSKIAADPEGAILINEAMRRGVKIFVGGFDRPDLLGITNSIGDKSTITVRDPNNIKTLVHELVHANSTQDGNSQLEEGIANILGKRVEARINGIPLQETPRATFINTVAKYPELMNSNAIQQTLQQLGITVNITG